MRADDAIARACEDVGFVAGFWTKVEKTETCWLWVAGRTRFGYGHINLPRKTGHALAHRFSWTLHSGDIPAGVCVLHRCDNPPCVNPAHLWLGTHAENMADCAAKGRSALHVRRLSADDVRSVRKALAEGRPGAAIARQFGVSHGCVYAIAHGLTFKHVM